MKKTFRSHVVLFTLGRVFILFILSFGTFLIYKFTRFAIVEKSIFFAFSSLYMLAILVLFCIVALPFLWKRAFEKLIVTEKSVIWKCLFYKKRKLDVQNINHIKIVSFDEGNYIRNNTLFLYVIMSNEYIPSLKVNKYKCNDNLIIFPLNESLCSALVETLDTRISKPLQEKLRFFNKEH